MNRLVHTAIALVLHSLAMSSYAHAGGGTRRQKTVTPSGSGTSIAPLPAPVKLAGLQLTTESVPVPIVGQCAVDGHIVRRHELSRSAEMRRTAHASSAVGLR